MRGRWSAEEQTAHRGSPCLAGPCPGPGAAQHAKVWVTPREGPPEGSLALGRIREAGSQGQALDLRMQVKHSSVLKSQRPEDGTGPLIKIPAQFHLLPGVGTHFFPSAPHGALLGFSHFLFTFCLVPWPHLAQDKAEPMSPAPTSHSVLLTATLGAMSVYLNL